MVRWRFVLFLAMLMLTHVSCSEDSEDDNQEVDEEENDDKDDDDDEPTEKFTQNSGRRAPTSPPSTKITRTLNKRPLECFICNYKKDAMVESCLDPSKFNVNTAICHNLNEKCFTAVETKESVIEMVTRGCRNSCVGTPDVTCCETNRCNNQKFSLPEAVVRATSNNASKSIQHSILYFVTILLLLQTVVKVNIL